MAKILVIDDDVMALELLDIFLGKEGYQVLTAKNGRLGLELVRKNAIDLVLLDLMMPGMDGFETYRRLREEGVNSIIMMSARQDEKNVVKALEMGVDDYIRKPVDLSVLLVKIKIAIQRNKISLPPEAPQYDDGVLKIDLETRTVKKNGTPIKLTPTEFRLLAILLRRIDRVVTHNSLIQEVWGTDKETSLGSLKLYIHYLRRKIEADPNQPHYLQAEWGIGYRFKNHQAGPPPA